MFSQDEFKKYATKHKGISSLNPSPVRICRLQLYKPDHYRGTPAKRGKHGRIFPVNDGPDHFSRSTYR